MPGRRALFADEESTRLDRRNFLRWLAVAAASGVTPRVALAADDDLYDVGRFGNVRILHLTDTPRPAAAGLFPRAERQYRRRRDARTTAASRRPRFPRTFRHRAGGRAAHAFTFLDYQDAAHRYGRMGGFAHLKTLIDRLRADAGPGNSLLLDGGDLWQGTGLANALQGADMVEAANLLGVDAMTGHWEFTYGEEDAATESRSLQRRVPGAECFLDRRSGVQRCAGVRSGIGPRLQAGDGARRSAACASPSSARPFPMCRSRIPSVLRPTGHSASASRSCRNWSTICAAREHADAVLLLSHNGMDVDLKLASRVTGIDVILGGHTHDAVPRPVLVANAGGKTVVTNAGSNGKFLAVLDLDVGKGALKDVRYTSAAGLRRSDQAGRAICRR